MSTQPIRTNPINGGERVPTAGRGDAGMPQEVYALLAQANLLRIRGNWDEAVEKCMTAMRLVPGNVAAQSLLGDIYENQGRLDEAIQWYRMALDTNPNSPADKQKLARLLAIKGQGADEIHDLCQASMSDARLPSGMLARSNALRATAMLCGACLFGVVLTAVVQSHGPADARARAGHVSTQVSSDPVTITQPAITGDGFSPSAAMPRDPFEAGLSNSLRNVDGMPQDTRFADVIADPRNGRLTLTYVVRPVIAIDRDSVVRHALHAAESASKVQGTGSYTYFTIRILLSSDDLVTSPNSGSLIFIGDTSRTDLVNYPTDVSSLTTGNLQGAFTNQWWAPGLAASSTTAAPSTGQSTPSTPTPAAPVTPSPQTTSTIPLPGGNTSSVTPPTGGAQGRFIP